MTRIEPAAGPAESGERDLFVHPLANPGWELLPAADVQLATRAFWAANLADEHDAPEHRVIHARAVFAPAPLEVTELLVRTAAGYHKCASGQERDAPRRVRVRVPNGDDWRVVADVSVSPDPDGTPVAVALDGLRTTALVAEVREAAVDRWWPGWNLTNTGLVLRGRTTAAWSPPPQGRLEVESVSLDGLPDGVAATHRNSEVRFSTPTLEVGFRLGSPAWSHLGLDADGAGRTGTNLLQMPRSMDIVRSGVYPSGVYPVLRDQNAGYLAQGPRLTRHDGRAPVGFLASDYHGITRVTANSVHYRVEVPAADQVLELTFTVERDRLLLSARRTGGAAVRTWSSSVWHVATDNRVTPCCAVGMPIRRGEAGLFAGDVGWHFPRFGTLAVSGTGPVSFRSDSVRALDTNTFEVKLGETPTADGDYLLAAGTHTAEVELRVVTAGTAVPLREGTPAVVRRSVERHALTALSFRADTATVSNNGASMHCTTSLNEVSAIAERLPALAAGIPPMRFVGLSLERWLDGAPSYGSGATSHGPHRLEDEYVQMAANTLTALARYLAWETDPGWWERYGIRVVEETEAMLARDVDGDGLVESVLRRGISGEHQWSTAWADVISFGGKDAWANAVLHETWGLLGPQLQRRGERALADRVAASRDALRESYLPTFHNPATGLVGGWRSADGRLHDYGFPLVNGAACAGELIEVPVAREIMDRLRQAWVEAGVTDLRNGLPLNLWRVPEADIGGVVFGLPLGGYQQGGVSHHNARVVVDALERVGHTALARELLVALSETIADDSSFGGLGSGRDWRMWDGTPSGYEGQLVEGFSVLATALRWYAADPPGGEGAGGG